MFREDPEGFAGVAITYEQSAARLGTEAPRGSEPLNQAAKRCFDVAASLLLIMALMPFMLIVAAIIMMIDRAPIIFVQDRIGRDGRRFRCYKFRTMVRDAKERLETILREDPKRRAEWEETQKLSDDPRILPFIGYVLRKSCLDELPQLFNVLKGDMSLVGPRPVTPAELERYGIWKTHYLAMRPGLTGAWQVNRSGNEAYDRRVRKDVEYVEDWSFSRDIGIILRTVRIVLLAKGSA